MSSEILTKLLDDDSAEPAIGYCLVNHKSRFTKLAGGRTVTIARGENPPAGTLASNLGKSMVKKYLGYKRSVCKAGGQL